MKKNMRKRKPKPGSIAYYIEEVIRYRSEHKAGEGLKDGYPPIVAELLLSMLISVRAIRFAFSLTAGTFIFLLLKLMFIL